ncbi:MAG: transglutaminase-like domain-containing protein [Lamprobacter sp.]|uniref:SirB1 family protein n=1 Tax=Lamprobacter sp. TaxID=3100796 RepID=UPI002B25FCD3|nr:transglutaminase-like domain-containing protein [Lamprobacter sp.]MEA3639523.1 transglutaminase-like domain-containing protein [Lamprobacter sp.]
MTNAQQAFAQLARQPDDGIDLAAAALAVSGLFQQDLAANETLAALDRLAAEAGTRLLPQADVFDKVRALNQFLFEEIGFAGNQDDFYDPRNSFLDQVLSRRLGIPITLSVLYIEIARRLGLPAYGVGFPGHFLVRIGRGDTALMLDVYAGGVALPEAELDQRLADLYGRGTLSIQSHPALLRPATKREILVRMLRNLTGIYRDRGERVNRLAALTASLTLAPNLPDELRERGLLYRDLDYTPAALGDLRRFVEVSDDAEQIAAVTRIIDELGGQPMRLH